MDDFISFKNGLGYWVAWIVTMAVTIKAYPFSKYMYSQGWELVDSHWWYGQRYERKRVPG